MGSFKDNIYHSLHHEVNRYENKESKKVPFLYVYLRRKKEADPRLVILNAYLTYLRGGRIAPQTVVSEAVRLLCKEHRDPEPLPGWKQLLEVTVRAGAANSASEALELLSDAERREAFLGGAEAKLFSPTLCRALAKDVREAFPYNEKRNDRYVQLRERDLLFQCEEDPDNRQYFLYLLDFLLSYVQPIKADAFSLIASIWEGLGYAVPAVSPRKSPVGGKTYDLFRKRLEAIRAVAEERLAEIRSEAIPGEKLHELAEQLQQLLIKADAAAWLYDAGYPLSEKGGREARRPRKADHTMDLLDALYRERGEWFGGEPSTTFDLKKSEKDIKALFKLLEAEKRRDVIIPITFDSVTGTGLYIIGTDHLKNTFATNFAEYRKTHSCCYNVTYPVGDPQEIKVYTNSAPMGVKMPCITYSMGDSLQIFENKLGEAYHYFSAITDLADAEGNNAYAFYQGFNQQAPEGCPEAYLKYFEEGDDWDDEDDFDEEDDLF